MRSHAPFEPTVTKFCVWGWVVDVIADAKFYGNRLTGFGVTGPRTPFPMLNVHRPYNSVSTTVLHCDWPQVESSNFMHLNKHSEFTNFKHKFKTNDHDFKM